MVGVVPPDSEHKSKASFSVTPQSAKSAATEDRVGDRVY